MGEIMHFQNSETRKLFVHISGLILYVRTKASFCLWSNESDAIYVIVY